jgi:MFS family permease
MATTNRTTPSDPISAAHSDRLLNSALMALTLVGWQAGMAFMALGTILPVLLGHLGAPNKTVGAVMALYSLLFSVTGVLAVRRARRLPRAKMFLFWVAMVERAAFLPLAFLIPLWGTEHPGWVIAAVFGCIAVHSAMMGLNQPAYWTVFSKVIPVAWRGRMTGVAGVLAGGAGVGVGYVLKHTLAGPNGGFPEAFGRVYLIGSVIFILAAVPYAFFKEPRHTETQSEDHNAGLGFQDGLRIWRTHAAFRRFLAAEVLAVLAGLSASYFVLHAERNLHAQAGLIASYTAILVISGAVGDLVGGVWCDRAGNRAVLLASIVGLVAANALAVAIKSPAVFEAVFVVSAMASIAFGLAGNNIIMEFAPSHADVPAYTAMNNVVMAVPRIAAPLLGGFIADGPGGYQGLFAAAVILALTALVGMLRTTDPRHQHTS